MDLHEAKRRLEMYRGTLVSSVEMYGNTIKQMIEKGSSPESVSFVLQMKKDAESQIEEVDVALRDASEDVSKGKSVLLAYNEIIDKLFKSFNPYFSNRFTVDFENDDVKDYFIESVSYDDNLIITFRNSEEFFVPEYFEKNKHFDKINLFLLSPVGEKKGLVEFKDVEVEKLGTDELTYTSNNILKTTVIFSFKEKTHKTI